MERVPTIAPIVRPADSAVKRTCAAGAIHTTEERVFQEVEEHAVGRSAPVALRSTTPNPKPANVIGPPVAAVFATARRVTTGASNVSVKIPVPTSREMATAAATEVAPQLERHTRLLALTHVVVRHIVEVRAAVALGSVGPKFSPDKVTEDPLWAAFEDELVTTGASKVKKFSMVPESIATEIVPDRTALVVELKLLKQSTLESEVHDVVKHIESPNRLVAVESNDRKLRPLNVTEITADLATL